MFTPGFLVGLGLFAFGLYAIRVPDRSKAVGTAVVERSEYGRRTMPGLGRIAFEGAGIGLLGLTLMLGATLL